MPIDGLQRDASVIPSCHETIPGNPVFPIPSQLLLNRLRRFLGSLHRALLVPAREPPRAPPMARWNNFDCVNDTGVEAHGFEIELDDVFSRDVTYTYDYNHYGIPKITEDLTDPLHPRVFIRCAAAKNPDGTWTAYTAVPSGPILPTDGHQFTDPTVNFGGEHFGAGYYGAPSAVKYNWLIDDGTGALVHGPPVYVSTPTFVHNPRPRPSWWPRCRRSLCLRLRPRRRCWPLAWRTG